MDSALLHGDIINVEDKRFELESQNLSRKEMKQQFESSYRVFSQKRAFTCLSCNEPVSLNLTNDEGRPFYFKHFDDNKCTYSENTKTYEKHVSSHQDKHKKDIGLTVFREILEGQLKPFGVKIERGYFYKKKLSFIPDFILRFPHSSDVWAIDYFTSVSQETYANHLPKRMSIYKQEGFKVFSFVDDHWLAVDKETGKGTLLYSEKQLISKHKEDHNWDQFLTQELSKDSLHFLKTNIIDFNSPINTQNIAYVNIEKRVCKLIRFLESSHTSKHQNLTIYKLSEPTIPLEQALTFDVHQTNFHLYKQNENQDREEFSRVLTLQMKEAEEKEKTRIKDIKRIEQEKANPEERRIHFTLEQSKVIENKFTERDKPINKIQQIEEEIERIMAERAREASERPVDISPERWEWMKKTDKIPFKNQAQPAYQRDVPAYESIEVKMDNDRREKFKDKVLHHPIDGSYYINGRSELWRDVVLKWIKERQSREYISVSMKKLIADLKASGISFNQNENLIQHPLKNFLMFYQKELKKDLKQVINISFTE